MKTFDELYVELETKARTRPPGSATVAASASPSVRATRVSIPAAAADVVSASRASRRVSAVIMRVPG